MKWLRILLAVVGAVLVLVVVAAVVLINRFDANDYKDEITAFVQERTGRTLGIEDEIELSLFPWFAVETGGITLSDDPAFGERSFIEIDSLSARVRVWPLLRRRVEIGRVVLDGVSLELGTDADGRGNWASLVETATPTANTDAADSGAEPAIERPFISRLDVAGIELRNTRVRWHDANGEAAWLVRDLELATGPVRDEAPVGLSLEFTVLDVASQATATIALNSVAALSGTPSFGNVELNLRLVDAGNVERARANLALDSIRYDGTRLVTSPAELTAQLTELPVGPDVIDLNLAFEALEFDRTGEQLAVPGLVLRAGDIEARVDLVGNAMLSSPQLSGRVKLSGPSLGNLLALADVALPAGINRNALGPFTAATDFELGLSPLTLAASELRLAALGAEATGTASLAADRGITAQIEIPAFRPPAALVDLLRAVLPDGVNAGVVTSVAASANLGFTPANDTLDVERFSLALDGARISGRLRKTGPGVTGTIRGNLTATGVDQRLLTSLAGPWLPEKLAAADPGAARLATSFDYAGTTKTAVFDPLEVAAYGLAGDGQLTLSHANGLRLAGRARLADFSPRELLARFDLPVPQSSDPGVLGSARLATNFETTGDSGRFRDIAITLDDSTITGEFSVENFANPSYTFALRADRIDADRYLPPGGDATPEAAAAGAAGVAGGADGDAERRLGDIRLASDALTDLALTGSVNVGELGIGGMRFEQLATQIAIGGGRASLRPVSTNLYGGTFNGGVALDATTDAPSLRLTGNANRLALRPLFEDMLGEAHISGTGNFELDLAGRGETIGEATGTAAGRLKVALANGQLEGINVGRSLCAAANSLRELPAPAAAPDATPFTTISASATVADGVATSSDLFATTGYLDLSGTGTIRLADQWLRNDFVARLSGPIPLAGCERLNSRIDGSIPIGFWLEGQLPDVDFGFDLGQLIEDWVRREIRNQAQDAIRDRLLEIFN